MSSVIEIGWPQMLLAAGFVFGVGILSMRLALGLEKDLLLSTIRAYAQLTLLGFVLRWVFNVDSPWPVIAIVALMIVMAARIIVKRSPDAPDNVFGSAVFSMAVTCLIVTFAVTGLVVRVDPWYEPRYVIPIAGMILGNSMTSIALVIERIFSDMDSRTDEILSMTALGATTWEAAHPSIRRALRAGLIPTINSMAAAGVVFIPGMMTGQILAGADPVTAAKYQIVVLLMISGATALGSVIAIALMYRRRFTETGVYLERGYRA